MRVGAKGVEMISTRSSVKSDKREEKSCCCEDRRGEERIDSPTSCLWRACVSVVDSFKGFRTSFSANDTRPLSPQ